MNVKQCSTEDELTNKLKILKQTKELVNNTQSELGLNFKPFPKQLEFLELTNHARITALIAGNGVGKTEFGMQMVKAFATGIYPDWWCGRRFDGATNGYIIKSTVKDMNDIIYDNLIGDEDGNRPPNPNKHMQSDIAVIPRHLIHIPKNKKSVKDHISGAIRVKCHNTSKRSKINLRTTAQGFTQIRGSNVHWIWIDEEIEIEYFEYLLERLRSSPLSCIFITATPDEGESGLYCRFVYKYDEKNNTQEIIPQKQVIDYRAYIRASWEDNPTLDEETKKMRRANYSADRLSIAEHGIPIAGKSSVFQIPEELFIKPAHEIILQTTWRYINGFDIGLNDATAIVYIAIDEDKDIIYIYDVYKVNNLRPSEHVNRLLTMSKNINIPHMIDKSANNRMIGETKYDIDTVAKQYRHYGVNVILSEDKLLKDLKMSTIGEFHERAYNGKIIISDACKPLIEEMRRYRRDDKGRIIKNNDHAIDAMFYGLLGWRKYAQYLVKSKYTPYPIRYF